MNIKGFLYLKSSGYPVPKLSEVFRKPNELNWDLILGDEYETRFLLVGFDDRGSIYDHPYKNRDTKIKSVSYDLFYSKWLELSSILTSRGIDPINQIFFLGKQFSQQNLKFSGMIKKEIDDNWFGEIVVDIKSGDRPPGVDWLPDYSLVLPIIAGRPSWSKEQVQNNNAITYLKRRFIARLVRDIRKIPFNAQLDFEVLADNDLVYHDMFLIP
ncbi:hypothetical protein [Candidatus Leptofilum sp.]|uniref:hypothetical protein n=1 Tax=Candidatus Leptofilum sp. TaxID=3241576 RepID=UPI003B5C2231